MLLPRRLRWAPAALLLAMPLRAGAVCLPSGEPDIREIEVLASADVVAAKARAQRLLDIELRANPVADSRIAALYAVIADANSGLELDRETREAVESGLRFAPEVARAPAVNLLYSLSEVTYDPAQIKSILDKVERTRAALPRGSAADICMQIALGRLYNRQDRDDRAVRVLTQAYRASGFTNFAQQRVLAATVLASVLRANADFHQALAINQEVVDWHVAHRNRFDLSIAVFIRGEILAAMKKYAEAIDSYEQARHLSEELKDSQGMAFADARMCQAHIELRSFEEARRRCRAALDTASSQFLKNEVRGLIAELDFEAGDLFSTLRGLMPLLDPKNADITPHRVATLFALRARAYAAWGRYKEAYQDLEEFARRNAQATDADRVRQTAELQARFEMDREVAKNSLLKDQLTLERERFQHQREQLRVSIFFVIAGAVAAALLGYILWASQRHKRQLVELARHDGLTGLPNRRRIVEVATEELRAASANHWPLTVAVIDLDHFKAINDCYGHAVGDHVLKEFAKLGKGVLRASDSLGRWGGEEFLLVLPRTTLDTAVASIERLRAAALQVSLPAVSDAFRLSFSTGLATNEGGAVTLDEIIARADRALYEAKGSGRDIVKIFGASLDSASSGVRRALRSQV